jgi:hypothetical protein
VPAVRDYLCRRWEITCAEVAKLRLTRSVGAGAALATVLATPARSPSRNVVEAAESNPRKHHTNTRACPLVRRFGSRPVPLNTASSRESWQRRHDEVRRPASAETRHLRSTWWTAPWRLRVGPRRGKHRRAGRISALLHQSSCWFDGEERGQLCLEVCRQSAGVLEAVRTRAVGTEDGAGGRDSDPSARRVNR